MPGAQPPDGRMLRRGEAGYEGARHRAVWNDRKPDRHPDRILLAQSIEDVVWGVRHAADAGLRISIRSGGHSWYGNGLRDAALLIDLSALADIEIDARAGTAVAGPGTLGRDLDARLAARGLFFPIGHCGTVGLGGFALGGGYGWNSRALGPAALNIRAIDVVLASGEHVHADASTHPDLLWAARGAGPGFFGVVTRLHLALAPRPRMLRVGHIYPLESHDEVLGWALEILARLPPEVEVSIRVGHSPRTGSPALTLTGMAFAGAGAGPQALLAPLGTCPALARALARFSTAVELLPDLHDRGIPGPSLRWEVDGIWTDAPAREILPAARAAGLHETPGEHSFVLWMLWGRHDARPDACWSMQAPLYLSPNAGWADPVEDARHERWVDDALRQLAPHSRGVQFSDANLPVRPGRGLSAANARRLEEIRASYDPEGRFCSYLLPPRAQPRQPECDRPETDRVKLAMNMLLWTDDITDPRHHELLELVGEAGYDGIEVPIFALEPAPYATLARRLEALGLAPLALTAPMPDANPISPRAEERALARERGLRAIECAAAVGAQILAGPFQATPTVFSGQAPTPSEREWAIEGLRALCERADGLGMTLALESLNHFEHYLTTTAAETAAMCRAVDHPRCRMLYDTFHAHMEEKDVHEAITACADVLGYVHLSESDRSTPGSAQVDWASTFAALREIGYDGWFTIEAFGTSHPELTRQMRSWRRRFESEEQLVREGARFVRAAWAAAGGTSA